MSIIIVTNFLNNSFYSKEEKKVLKKKQKLEGFINFNYNFYKLGIFLFGYNKIGKTI